MYGTGGVHGVATSDRGVAGHALNSPERQGERGLDISTGGKLDLKHGVD